MYNDEDDDNNNNNNNRKHSESSKPSPRIKIKEIRSALQRTCTLYTQIELLWPGRIISVEYVIYIQGMIQR